MSNAEIFNTPASIDLHGPNVVAIQKYVTRLLTFHGVETGTNGIPKAEDLAAAGFIYNGSVHKLPDLKVMQCSRINALETEIREICYSIQGFSGIRIFMFGTYEPTLRVNDEVKFIGSIYFLDINSRLGSIDVFREASGNSRVLQPGIFVLHYTDIEETSQMSRIPTEFYTFPSHADFIDIHRFRSQSQQAVYIPQTCVGQATTIDRNHENYRTVPVLELSEIISRRDQPCTPGMQTVNQRMHTFRDWRLTGKRDAERTAEAGFFYTGPGNNAECFHCGLRIYEWVEAPVIEHIRWAPGCQFLREKYSLDFIYNILFNRHEFEVD